MTTITITISTGEGGTDMGYNKMGEPANEQETIMLTEIVYALDQAVQSLVAMSGAPAKFVEQKPVVHN